MRTKMINVDLLTTISELSKIRLNDIMIIVYELLNTIEYMLKTKEVEEIKTYTEDEFLYKVLSKNLESYNDFLKLEEVYCELFEVLAY